MRSFLPRASICVGTEVRLGEVGWVLFLRGLRSTGHPRPTSVLKGMAASRDQSSAPRVANPSFFLQGLEKLMGP